MTRIKPTQGISLSRRDFVALVGGAALATGATRRAFGQTPSAPLPATFSESPILAELVAAGTLPPVAERLPTNPMIVQPNDVVGKHGGTWRTAIVGGSDLSWLT